MYELKVVKHGESIRHSCRYSQHSTSGISRSCATPNTQDRRMPKVECEWKVLEYGESIKIH